MNYKDNIADILVKARKKMQMSQDVLAKKMFVTRQAVSNWENGKAYPDISLIFKLCKILKIDIKQIVDLDENIKIEDLIMVEKRKTNRRNLIFGGIIVLMLLAIIGTLIIVFNRNAFEVYNVYLDSAEFELDNCIIVKSKVKNYFQFGTLISKLDNTDENTIYNIRMYKLDQDKERLIFEQTYERNIKIIENYGYKEYFDDLNVDLNNLYLEISYNVDNKKVIYNYKLRIEEVFKNDNIIFLKSEKIGNEEITNETKIDENKLYELGYILNDNQTMYSKSDVNGDIDVYYKANLITLKKEIKKGTLLLYYYLNRGHIRLCILKDGEEKLNQYFEINDYEGIYEKEVETLKKLYENIKGK